MATAFLGLGSNLGDRILNLEACVAALEAETTISVCRMSDVYETEAHVPADRGPDPDFLNMVVEIETNLAPGLLLVLCLEIERLMGRTRTSDKWLPRTIDIDILLVNGFTIADDQLTVPHPRLHLRRFVLQPLSDLVPNMVVPRPFGQTVSQLLEACPDEARVHRFSTPKTKLAE